MVLLWSTIGLRAEGRVGPRGRSTVGNADNEINFAPARPDAIFGISRDAARRSCAIAVPLEHRTADQHQAV
eukprot:895174-Prymnesium_polylepis.1